MWEVRAAAGRLADLVAYVLDWAGPDVSGPDVSGPDAAGPDIQVYRSPAGDPDERLVVLDPGCRRVPDLPADLVARPPHAWDFERA